MFSNRHIPTFLLNNLANLVSVQIRKKLCFIINFDDFLNFFFGPVDAVDT